MLRISTSIVEGVRKASSAHTLSQYLQSAVQLEHATIPPYLTAWFSIKRNTNTEVRSIVGGIFMDEMLHMAIAANVMNALGSSPVLNAPDFIPTFPGNLPMNVDPALIVGLEKLSKDLVRDTFMSIEEPEDPEEYPLKPLARLPSDEPTYATIGQFYAAIIGRIGDLGDAIFTGDPARQLVDPASFPERDLFPVVNAESAMRALGVIVEQGEGTPRKPINPDGEVAHYYRFEQIIMGRKLIPADTPLGYAYAGDEVPFDPSGIINIVENSKSSMYAPASPARLAVDAFNAAYTEMLKALHDTFNGDLGRYYDATDLMSNLTGLARKTVAIEIADGVFAAPSFEYVSSG